MDTLSIIEKLRIQIGDTDLTDPNITDEELTLILNNAAMEFSRLKGFIKTVDIPYIMFQEIYTLPSDLFRVVNVKYVVSNSEFYNVKFTDNMTQLIISSNEVANPSGLNVLRITYNSFLKLEEIDERSLDLLLLYAEGLCYKLMASKTAGLIKFSTGEKTIDESDLSKKYMELYEKIRKEYRSRVIKAHGRRADNIKENLDYMLTYPTKGEIL